MALLFVITGTDPCAVLCVWSGVLTLSLYAWSHVSLQNPGSPKSPEPSPPCPYRRLPPPESRSWVLCPLDVDLSFKMTTTHPAYQGTSK